MSLFQSSHLSTWADRAEVDELFSKDQLSMEEFAKCLYELVMNRCELNLTGDKPVFFFKVNDTFIDIMIRDHMIISISSKKVGDNDKVSSSSSEEEEQEDYENHSESSKTSETPEKTVLSNVVGKVAKVEEEKVVHDNVFASLQNEVEDTEEVEEEEVEVVAKAVSPPKQTVQSELSAVRMEPVNEKDDGEWSTVVSKKVRNVSKEIKVKPSESTKDLKHIYFFRDEANSSFADFVCQLYTVKDMVKLARTEIWSHGYCMESNTVYDFNDCRRPGSYRCFTPNEAYMHRFSAWFHDYEKNNFKAENKDHRKFHVFTEKSTWNEWQFLGVAEGMAEVRRIVKDVIFEHRWAHAYNIQDNELVNFVLDKETNSLLQKQTEAPEKYLERFDTFLAQL
jgi:hypothetical protein